MHLTHTLISLSLGINLDLSLSLSLPLSSFLSLNLFFPFLDQLLYVYINDYQSGGEMWYAVFSRSLIALLFAAFTLLGYLSLELNQTYLAGPFYFLLPLPFSIIYFWHYCEAKFKAPSMVRRTMNFIDFNFL